MSSLHKKNFSYEVRMKVANDNNWICHLCTHEIADRYDLTMDHVIPLAKGGIDDVINLKPAHRKCNELKADADSLTEDQIKELYPDLPNNSFGGTYFGDFLSKIIK